MRSILFAVIFGIASPACGSSPADTDSLTLKGDSIGSVMISVESGVLGSLAEGARRGVLVISGKDSSLTRLRILESGDTTRHFIRTLSENEILGLLNRFYAIRYFGYLDSYYSSPPSVFIDPSSKRLRLRIQQTHDAGSTRVCVRVGELQKCIGMLRKYAPPDLQELVEHLLALDAIDAAVSAPQSPDDLSPPAEYALDGVTIWTARGPGATTREINGHRVVHTRLTIRGADGVVEEVIATARGDTARRAIRTIPDTALVDLLNEFYLSGFFGYRPDPARRAGVALVPGTRRLAPITRGVMDFVPTDICIEIERYRRCVEVSWSAPRELFELRNHLWALRDSL